MNDNSAIKISQCATCRNQYLLFDSDIVANWGIIGNTFYTTGNGRGIIEDVNF
jgi:hypothetical protein